MIVLRLIIISNDFVMTFLDFLWKSLRNLPFLNHLQRQDKLEKAAELRHNVVMDRVASADSITVCPPPLGGRENIYGCINRKYAS